MRGTNKEYAAWRGKPNGLLVKQGLGILLGSRQRVFDLVATAAQTGGWARCTGGLANRVRP